MHELIEGGKNLTTEDFLSIHQLGELDTNTYILGDKYVIDPGGWNKKLSDRLAAGQGQPVILLTHAHYDHILGVPEILEDFPEAEIYCHQAEEKVLADPARNFTGMSGEGFGLEPTGYSDKSNLEFQNGKFKVLHLPGHTPGGAGYYLPRKQIIFSGDVLFKRGLGRTDLPGGDRQQILKSLNQKLLKLPAETTVYPGHGPSTTIEAELNSNPYLN